VQYWGARLQNCTRVRWHSGSICTWTQTHKPGARLQYCTRVRWDSVVFVHELRHTNQELDCSPSDPCTVLQSSSWFVSEFMYKYYWVPSDPCAVLQSSSWFVSEFMYKYYWVPSDPCTVLQSSSWFCTLTQTHKPGARLQYCTRVRWHSVVFVHELRHTNQELDCSWFVCVSSCTNTTECHLTLVQYCSLAPGLCVWVHVQILLSAHKAGARMQYCTRVRWHSVVFVH
jgi:hypothetical protein